MIFRLSLLLVMVFILYAGINGYSGEQPSAPVSGRWQKLTDQGQPLDDPAGVAEGAGSPQQPDKQSKAGQQSRKQATGDEPDGKAASA